jgi:Prokaryotic N-terminal methylation motif
MYRRKHAFSLLEILIAFTLASILFGCIFLNFSQTNQLQSQLEKAHSLAVNRQGMQLQLQSLLINLPTSIEGQEKSDSPLYIADFNPKRTKALWFTLKVDYSDDKRFIGPLTYCLYHNEKSHTLQLMARNSHGDEKIEEIMRHVQAWEFSLFDPEKKSWVTTWPQDINYLPTCLKLQIFEKERKEKSEPLEFTFMLPASTQAVVYKS